MRDASLPSRTVQAAPRWKTPTCERYLRPPIASCSWPTACGECSSDGNPSSRASLARPASRLLMPILVVIALSVAGAAGQLRVHTSSSTGIPSSLIVGRAVCAHGTWLLSDRLDLIVITDPAR